MNRLTVCWSSFCSSVILKSTPYSFPAFQRAATFSKKPFDVQECIAAMRVVSTSPSRCSESNYQRNLWRAGREERSRLERRPASVLIEEHWIVADHRCRRIQHVKPRSFADG